MKGHLGQIEHLADTNFMNIYIIICENKILTFLLIMKSACLVHSKIYQNY